MTPAVTPVVKAGARRTLSGHRSVYLIGIGGTGMCGAAELLKARGVEVRGSDRAPSRRTERLGRMGIAVDADLHAASIPEGTTLVIASAAVPLDHPQVVEATRRGLPVWKYAECLGALMEGRLGIAVAGCHGKTTTSSLVATCLWRAGRDPSFVVGGEVRDLATSARPGRGPHFVAEACEYDRSFHRLTPTIALVTNVDLDHLDYYRDLEEIRESFRTFARLLPRDGLLVVHEDHADVFRSAEIAAPIETYGFGARADWRATDAWWDGGDDVQRFRVSHGGRLAGLVTLPLAGQHHALNATGAAAVLSAAGLSFEETARGLAHFGGVGRRLERVVEARGILVLDDYGHHPAEIRAVVRAIRTQHPGRRLVLVFQPHQASRTLHLLDDFGAALAEADEAWVAPIFSARDTEADRRRVAAADVAQRAVHCGGRSIAFIDLPSIVEYAVERLRAGDVFVTMGAGDVDEVAHGLRDRLR